jgi:hypothetical protein
MIALHRLAGTQLDLRPTRHVYVEAASIWAMPSARAGREPSQSALSWPVRATIAIAVTLWVYVMLVAALVLL